MRFRGDANVVPLSKNLVSLTSVVGKFLKRVRGDKIYMHLKEMS